MTRARLNGGSIGLNNSTSLSSAYGVFALAEQSSYVLAGRWPSVPGQFNINNSLRFRSSASAYLNRTPASASNLQTWTWSGWLKRGKLSTQTAILQAGTNGTNDTGIYFRTDDAIDFYTRTSGTIQGYITTAAVYRDPSAWYHFVFVFDSTNATAANRMRIYCNGVLQTVTITNTLPQNTNGFVSSNVGHYIGELSISAAYLDGYLAEVNFIDGQALTASSFGTYDTNGVWQPIKYSGTYGTNGFYLPFTNTASTATLGNDFSGNSNTWTVNNISLTAGVTYDSMNDSPTVSSTSVANYAVLNPLAWRTVYSNTVPTNGNLTGTGADNFHYFTATMASSGLYYFEMTATTVAGSGAYVAIWQSENPQSGTVTACDYYSSTGVVTVLGTTVFTGATYTSGDVIGFAHNTLAGTVAVYKNGTLQGTATGLPATIKLYPGCLTGAGTVFNANFGQRPFAYTPPTGFNALNTYNLPTPTIANGAQYMAATLYTGNGTSQAVSNAVNGQSFQPDFVWVKGRSVATNHILVDSVRGVTKDLQSNTTAAEATVGDVSALNSNGFTAQYVSGETNANGSTYVGWNWKAGNSSGSSNTNGSITSTVSANTTAGFSIVTYTGTGASNATVGHGLGVAPSMVIVKARGAATDGNWRVKTTSLSSNYNLALNTTDAQFNVASSTNGGIGDLSSSTTFTLANGTINNNNVNQNTIAYVAYCWAAVAGYSAFGSYTGNGSTDGPFIYLGFRPRWWLVKRTDTVESWNILDSSRDPYNQAGINLYPNLTNAESSNDLADLVSNGVKLRNTWTGANTNGGTYIYAAFAENPFNTARAR